MKQRILAAILATAVTLAMTACGSAPTPTPSTADGGAVAPGADKGLSGTVTIWSWDVALAHLQSEAEKFNQIHPDVEFVFEEMGVDQVYKKITTSLQSGIGLPDIVQLEGEQMAKFGGKFPGQFVEFTNELKAEEYLPIKVAECTIDGKLVAYPWDAGPCGMFYRDDIFQAAGVKAEDIVTWDDFIEAGKKVKASTGAAMISIPTARSDIAYRMLMMELGGFYFTNDGKSSVNSPESIRAMEMVKRLYTEDIIFNDTSWDDKMAAITGNMVACIPEAVWLAGSIKDVAPDQAGKWRVMGLPRFDKDTPVQSASNGGSVLAVPTASQNRDAAVEFIKFAMTDIKGNEEGFQNYGLYPSHIPSLDSEVFQQGDPYFGDQKIYDLFTELGKNSPTVNYTSNFAEVLELSKNAQAAVLLENKDVTEAMNNLQNEMVSKFGQ